MRYEGQGAHCSSRAQVDGARSFPHQERQFTYLLATVFAARCTGVGGGAAGPQRLNHLGTCAGRQQWHLCQRPCAIV